MCSVCKSKEKMSGVYAFGPCAACQLITKEQEEQAQRDWIKRRDALEKRLQEAHIRLELEETGGDAA